MTQEHTITPPPKLVKQWWKEAQQADYSDGLPCWLNYVATQAARWGADQELEACCSQLAYWGVHGYNKLYEARRPKPPSLKEQALLQLDTLNADLSMHGLGCDLSQIRRALESLPE